MQPGDGVEVPGQSALEYGFGNPGGVFIDTPEGVEKLLYGHFARANTPIFVGWLHHAPAAAS